MVKFPILSEARRALEMQSEPDPAVLGQAECSWHTIYDTATFAATTTRLMFFNTARANEQLSNFGGRGQFSEPQYFVPWCVMFDPIYVPGATSFVKLHHLFFGSGTAGEAAPTIDLIYASKRYGPWPLSMSHSTGGPVGMSDTFTAVPANELSLNAKPDGGIWLNGQTVTFAPNQNFKVILQWDGAIAALPASINVRVSIAGVWYRRVS